MPKSSKKTLLFVWISPEWEAVAIAFATWRIQYTRVKRNTSTCITDEVFAVDFQESCTKSSPTNVAVGLQFYKIFCGNINLR